MDSDEKEFDDHLMRDLDISEKLQRHIEAMAAAEGYRPGELIKLMVELEVAHRLYRSAYGGGDAPSDEEALRFLYQ